MRKYSNLDTKSSRAVRVEATTVLPTTAGPAAGPQNQEVNGPDLVAPPLNRVSASFLSWITVANFGASLALMVPLTYSLAVRVTQLAPGHEEVLGYVTGTAQLIYLVLSPLLGVWSDRLRSPFGRRTPFIVGRCAGRPGGGRVHRRRPEHPPRRRRLGGRSAGLGDGRSGNSDDARRPGSRGAARTRFRADRGDHADRAGVRHRHRLRGGVLHPDDLRAPGRHRLGADPGVRVHQAGGELARASSGTTPSE